MAQIKFTQALKRFYPDLQPLEIPGDNVATVIIELEKKYPGLRHYLVDETGQLRKHVNIFVNERLIKDRNHLMDVLSAEDEVYIMQALSGG